MRKFCFIQSPKKIAPTPTVSQNVPEETLVEPEPPQQEDTIYKTTRIIGVNLQNQNQGVQKELSSGQAMSPSYSSFCGGLSLRVTGGLIYQSSNDNFTNVRYKNMDLNCSETSVIAIE